MNAVSIKIKKSTDATDRVTSLQKAKFISYYLKCEIKVSKSNVEVSEGLSQSIKYHRKRKNLQP